MNRNLTENNTMNRSVIFAYLTGIASVIGVAGILVMGDMEAEAQSAVSSGVAVRTPTGTVPELDVYYPGTEALAPDEMRIVALGTGMPSARPKAGRGLLAGRAWEWRQVSVRYRRWLRRTSCRTEDSLRLLEQGIYRPPARRSHG